MSRHSAVLLVFACGAACSRYAEDGCGGVAVAPDAGGEGGQERAHYRPTAPLPIRTPAAILRRLDLWLDADAGDTLVVDTYGNVVKWMDHRPLVGPQTVPAVWWGLPRSHIAAIPGIANGHTALKVGAQSGMFVCDCVRGLFVVVVAAYSNPASTTAVLYQHVDHQPFAPILDGPRLFGNWQGRTTVFFGLSSQTGVVTSSEGWNDGNFHTFGFQRDVGNKIALRVDGQESVGTDTTNTPSNTTLTIGGDYSLPSDGGAPPSIFNALEGYIAEVLISDEIVTSEQRVQLGRYFRDKYNVPF